MSGSRDTIKGLLVDLFVFLLLFSVLSFAYQSVYGYMPWIYLLLALPFLFLSFMRSLLDNRLIFFLLHLILIVTPWLLPFDFDVRVLLFSFMLAGVIYSTATKIVGQWSLNHKSAIFGIIVNLVIFILLNRFDSGGDAIFAYLNVSTLIILLAVILSVHLENLYFNLLVHYRKYKRPYGGIITVNNRLVFVFIAVLLGLGFISVITPTGPALTMVLSGAYDIFAWILMSLIQVFINIMAFFFPYFEQGFPRFGRFDADPPPTVFPDVDWLFDDIYAYETVAEYEWPFFTLVTLLIVSIFSGLFMAVVFIIYLYRKISLDFTKNDTRRRTIAAEDDSIGRVKNIMSGLSQLIPRIRSLVKHPVRRAYAKKVRSYIRRGVVILPHDTPDTIASKISHIENIDDFTAKYERIRYGRGQ
ncbi:MAG: hypothetical protein FWC77_04855 [Defluviitaleaceae bacterium]|nr:hypothetical protein [Defluviitaleaceae bacterium]